MVGFDSITPYVDEISEIIIDYIKQKYPIDKKGFPDFTDKITQLDFKGLNDLTYVMENKLFETPKLSKIPNFSSVSELRVFLGRSTFDN